MPILNSHIQNNTPKIAYDYVNYCLASKIIVLSFPQLNHLLEDPLIYLRITESMKKYCVDFT